VKRKIKRKSQYYVYIFRCNDGTYYTGYTSNLANRIKEHNTGRRGAKYLRGKLPVKLVYIKEYSYYKRAVDRERSIKRLGHRQKEELVKIYEKNQARQ
jgi:putative endonuclease